MAGSETLPYSLKTLTWDTAHQFNSQNKYGYTGKPRKLCDPMLQCEVCDQWFHLKEVSCVSESDGFVAFQRNYRFQCRICAGGEERWELLTNTWTSIVLTAMYNLFLSEDGTTLDAALKWVKIKAISEWVEAHWGSLTAGRDLQQLRENNAVSKCLQVGANATIFALNEDKTEATLKTFAPSKLMLKPLQSATLTSMPLTSMSKAPKAGEAGKRKRGGKNQHTAKEENKKPTAPAPSMADIKLPDKYKLLPVPKTEASHAQAASRPCLLLTAVRAGVLIGTGSSG